VGGADLSRISLRNAGFVGSLGLVGGVPGAGIAGTGGTESTITVTGQDYRLHVFTTSGTFGIVPGFSQIVGVEYLVVGGGGGGGSNNTAGGGGGGGGLATGTVSITNAQTVTVGLGGAGASAGRMLVVLTGRRLRSVPYRVMAAAAAAGTR
jgi:hypothetical protein